MTVKIAIIAVALIGVVVFQLLRSAGNVSGAEARKLVADGARLIDVRSPSEFSGGHIDGAINIPVDRITGRLGEVGDKSDAIVLYCRSGARSSRAKGILESAGFTNVSNLGGMHRW